MTHMCDEAQARRVVGRRHRVDRRRSPAVLVVAVAALVMVGGCVGATNVSERRTSARGSTSTPTSTPTTAPAGCAASLGASERLGQLMMVLVSDPRVVAADLAAGRVGGFAIVGTPPADLADAITEARRGAWLPPFASGDEEGGSVQRLRELLGKLPSARSLASSSTPEEAARLHGDYATRLRGLGFTMNLGPVFDVGSGSGLGDRTFGTDVDTVVRYALPVAQAVRAAGLIPVAKHWPGIGRGTADPHTARSDVGSIDRLRSSDLVAFDRAIEGDVPAVMVSHVVVDGLTDGLPASISAPAITGELRGRQHFDGLVITDSLGMDAVLEGRTEPEAALAALRAGADVVLISGPAQVAPTLARLTAALDAGELGATDVERSVARVLALKGIAGACPPRPA